MLDSTSPTQSFGARKSENQLAEYFARVIAGERTPRIAFANDQETGPDHFLLDLLSATIDRTAIVVWQLLPCRAVGSRLSLDASQYIILLTPVAMLN